MPLLLLRSLEHLHHLVLEALLVFAHLLQELALEVLFLAQFAESLPLQVVHFGLQLLQLAGYQKKVTPAALLYFLEK